jgi:hypothetical protein
MGAAKESVGKGPDIRDRVNGTLNKGPDFIDEDAGEPHDMTTMGQLQAPRLKNGDDRMHRATNGKTIDPQPPMLRTMSDPHGMTSQNLPDRPNHGELGMQKIGLAHYFGEHYLRSLHETVHSPSRPQSAPRSYVHR